MKFILNKDTLKIKDAKIINSGSKNYYEADVEYDESWENLIIEAKIVKKGHEVGTPRSVINNKIFIDVEDDCRYCVGFVGYIIKDGIMVYQISSNLQPLTPEMGAGQIKTSAPALPTPTEWEVYIAQIQEMIKSVNSIPSGGEAGQVLVKKSDKDYDYEWGNPEGAGGIGEEEDPTIPEHVKNIKEQDIKNWNNKVDKITGKGLSSNDFTDEQKEKLDNLNNYDDTQIKKDIEDKQDKLISGKNIKTINGQSILGAGNKTLEELGIQPKGEYITKSVNDLLNYYLKSESYSKEEINIIIGQIKTISIQKVEELPLIGNSNIIYLVPKEGSANDIHNEYIYINNSWELIGSTQIDLTGYATENWVNIQIKDLLNEAQVNSLIATALSNHYTKEQINKLLEGKVSTEEGKSLSANDYTDEEKQKLASLKNYDDTALREEIKSKASIQDMKDYVEENKEEFEGEPGPQGEPGYTPIKGTDYYTEKDKEEMVNLVLEALPSSEEVEY